MEFCFFFLLGRVGLNIRDDVSSRCFIYLIVVFASVRVVGR